VSNIFIISYKSIREEGVLNTFGKQKIPPKIRIWLWLNWNNTIATKDNMEKRGWLGF
jgi:hypothetical protein